MLLQSARRTSNSSQSVLRRTSANMPRVRCLVSVPVLCIILVHALFGIDIVTADCWYDNEKHEEGVEVATTEPCLNCTCSRGALLCYLRVCPKLPNPPPPGCILLHRYRSCCPELICAEMPSGKRIEGRSESDPMDVENAKIKMNLRNACMANGSIYGPGSAMDSSSQCEYCYCLGGHQRCVKPKCLLPLDGCVPAYNSNECCPARYNCTRNIFTSTTTLAPDEYESKGGCIVSAKFYQEGGKVLGVGHSICDNCYCLRGLVRCEPLSCAPPLLGCTPVVKIGECCAASYNCSGTIETQPEPNYGQFPTVSKDYAKLRKEVQHKRTTSKYISDLNASRNTNKPYYVLAETTKAHKSLPTTRQYTRPNLGTITQSPFYYNISKLSELNVKDPINNRANDTYPEIYYASTKVHKSTTNYPKNNELLYDIDALSTTIRHKKYTSNVLKLEDLLEGRINRRIDSQNNSNIIEPVMNATTTTELETDVATSTILITTEVPEESTTIEATTALLNLTKVYETTDVDLLQATDGTTEAVTSTDLNTQMSTQEVETTVEPFIQQLITVTTVINTTDCGPKLEQIELRQEEVAIETTTAFDTTLDTTTGFDVTEVDLESKVQITTVSPKATSDLDLEAGNKTKSKEHDYDYDYNAPTLPPSLPNLRIIPFVAADALDSKKPVVKNNNIFPQDKVSDSSFPFNNLFSPPDKTEGGFVPKEPSILNMFYDSNYQTTNIGTNTETSLPVPAITNPPKLDENNCMVDGKEFTHGESVASEGTCALCICYYGSIVCHEPQCPNPRNGCRNSNTIDRSTCCPHLICDDEESPTVVLDRLEVTSKSPESATTADGVATPMDPFRDVIRTEPAPNLHSLMGDMSNFLSKQTTTTQQTTTPTKSNALDLNNNTSYTTINDTKTTHEDDDSFSLDKVWQLLFSADLNVEPTTSTEQPTITKHVFSETHTTIQPATSTSNLLNLEIRTANHNLLETRENINDNLVKQPHNIDHGGAGLLKLAGCNIYGRMYRVGRIISELSGPCLECKCTEVGVQCEALTC